MIKTWEDTPFISSSGALQEDNTETKLPFSIGGVTRQGFEHIRLGISNQDAINIRVDDDIIIGVLCDGCTTNHESLINDFSYNNVGASLLSNMIVNLCYSNIKTRKNKINKIKFLKWLTKNTISKLNGIVRKLNVPINEKIPTLNNLFTTTIIGFIIRKNEYFAFHCGDGIVQINSKIYDLSFDSGRYISGHLIKGKKDSAFKLIENGATSKLQHLFIASDGFQENKITQSVSFKNILNKSSQKHTGFIDLIPEFHLNLLDKFYEKNEHEESWPKDDSSLIMLRRTNKK